ncbi:MULTISPECIES: MauE/DoxX family redox-associated membrane protein [Sphingobacterium]|uniref:MauE/DoxX family redox-associated membrane protein n=1 Tax=Sphingobacterium TaxID=28453 RepID=UPI0035E4221E
MQKKRIFTEIVVVLLVILFLYTGVSKFVDFEGFTYDLNNQPFHNSLTPLLRWLIPITEISIVLALLFDKARLMGLYASLFLMSLFTIYTALVLFHVFEYVPCSCGGVIKNLTWPQHLIFNLFFVVITSLAIRVNKKNSSDHLLYNQLQ